MGRLRPVLAAVVLSCGCATTTSVTSDPQDAGQRFRFAEPCETLAALVVPTLADLGFAMHTTEAAEPCGITVVARKPVSLASWGELVRVIVLPVDGGTEVTVLTRRVLATNVTARGDWSGEIYRGLLRAIEAGSRDDPT